MWRVWRGISVALALGLSALLWSATAGAEQEEPPDFWTYEWDSTDFTKASVSFEEITSGGPRKDGIPSIDHPVFAPVNQIVELPETEPVISVFINDDHRAYPLRILMWHEIVNDTVGGVPIAVTYCPLCNSAVVYERTVDGRVLDFGTTGKLRNSDLVMYDRQTESWWQQFVGEAIIGEMLGTMLTPVPVRVESFARFKARANDTAQVLVPTRAGMRNYGFNPYSRYDSAKRPFLYRGPLPSDIAPLARVVVVGKEAWSLELLQEIKRLEHGDLVITWEPGQNSALDTSMIKLGRDIGNVVVQRQGANGLEDAVHDISFAFAFHAFHPDGQIYTAVE